MAKGTPEFTFILHEGYPRNMVLARLAATCKNLPLSDDWEITVKRRRHQRSSSQNRLFHKLVRDLSSFIGQSFGATKEEVKETFGPRILITGLDGKEKEIPKPTEEYEVEEMSDVITLMLKAMSDLGMHVETYEAEHREQTAVRNEG